MQLVQFILPEMPVRVTPHSPTPPHPPPPKNPESGENSWKTYNLGRNTIKQAKCNLTFHFRTIHLLKSEKNSVETGISVLQFLQTPASSYVHFSMLWVLTCTDFTKPSPRIWKSATIASKFGISSGSLPAAWVSLGILPCACFTCEIHVFQHGTKKMMCELVVSFPNILCHYSSFLLDGCVCGNLIEHFSYLHNI